MHEVTKATKWHFYENMMFLDQGRAQGIQTQSSLLKLDASASDAGSVFMDVPSTTSTAELTRQAGPEEFTLGTQTVCEKEEDNCSEIEQFVEQPIDETQPLQHKNQVGWTPANQRKRKGKREDARQARQAYYMEVMHELKKSRHEPEQDELFCNYLASCLKQVDPGKKLEVHSKLLEIVTQYTKAQEPQD